jgi:phosphoribosylformylglycinamidine (FGAM) synthase-like enzyme
MEITVETAQKLRLTAEEFELIKQKLGRTPNFTELCSFSAMWSEHCSYKNSIKWLKTLPRDGGRMLVAAGEENAGLMDMGGGFGVVFKIESHNHPSALEPFQGAATGVGGIQRDIFTMGARPIAQLNSLRFGNIALAKTKWLVKGVVKGIGDYGNAFGIPTVGGEVFFDEACRKPNRVEDLRAAIGLIGADAHLGHHLHHALADRLDEVLLHLIRLQLHIHALADLFQRFKCKIGVHRFRAIAGQHAEMMHLPRFTRFHHKPGGSPEALTDQMMMHRRCCQ